MSKFEDQLLADLMRTHGTELAEVRQPAAHRRAPRPVWIAAGVVGLAGAITLGVTVAGTGTPAYAVTHGRDGTITVSLRKITGVDGANAELRRLGVPAVAVPMREDCTATFTPDNPSRKGSFSMTARGDGQSGSVTFDPSAIPAGDTMILAAQASPGGGVALGTAFTRGPVPECLPLVPRAGQGDVQGSEVQGGPEGGAADMSGTSPDASAPKLTTSH
jgi:hypothetical protein